MTESPKYLTIPKLAHRLGVTPASVREWIAKGLIEEPQLLPVTEERAYPAEAAKRIEVWYMKRSAEGGTRGPGTSTRRKRAQAWLAAVDSAPNKRHPLAQSNAEPSNDER